MKLHEIIKINETGKDAIITEELYKYRNSLLTYYRNQYGRNCEPVLMVTSVFNACQYAIIVPETEFNEAIDLYLQDSELTGEDLENERELISFQSIPLYNF